PEAQVFRVSLDGGAPERVTKEAGVHVADFARTGDRVWVESVTTPTQLRRAVVHVVDDKGDRVAGELPSVAAKPPFMSTELVERVGDLGYWTALVRPRNFDPKRKYPVVVD